MMIWIFPLDPRRARSDQEKDKFLSWWFGFSRWIRKGQNQGWISACSSVVGTGSRGVGASFRGIAFRNVFWVRPPLSRLLLGNLDKHRPYSVWGLPVPFQPWGSYHLSHGFCISKLNKWLYELEHPRCSWFLGLVKCLRPCFWPP